MFLQKIVVKYHANKHKLWYFVFETEIEGEKLVVNGH